MLEQIDLIARLYPELDAAARSTAETLIELALREDLCDGVDLTAEAIIPESAQGSALFVVREAGVVAGLPVAHRVAMLFGLGKGFRALARDGDHVEPGTAIGSIAGPMRNLLRMERTALNFLGRLSGIASLTAQFVGETAGKTARILDTRKTTPGWRALEKYAVRCGGGHNHRFGLFDQVLIKDNHLAWLALSGDIDPVGAAVAAAREKAPLGTVVEVEVDTLVQLERALAARPDIILLDNLGPADVAEAVRRRDAVVPGLLLEASGGVTLESVANLAQTGVDRISVGALTHSARALDLGLDFDRSDLSDP